MDNYGDDNKNMYISEQTTNIKDLEKKINIKIPFEEKSYTFEKNTYDPILLSTMISEKDYNDIIKNCSKIIGRSLIEKRNNDRINMPHLLIIMMIILYILLVLFFSTLSAAMSRNEDKQGCFIAAVIIFVVIIICAFPLTIYNFWYPIRTFRNLSYFIVENINKYLKEVNERYNYIFKFGLNDNDSEESRFLYLIITNINEDKNKKKSTRKAAR